MEQPRQVNRLGTILCAIQCETVGWGGLPGILLPDTDCKFQGHFSTVWVVFKRASRLPRWMEPMEGAWDAMGWDEGSIQLPSYRSGGLCDAMLSRVPHIPTLDKSTNKGLTETIGIS